MATSLTVGYSKCRITPPLEVPYLSFAPRLTTFRSIHDDLYARAVAIGSPTRTAVIVSMDALGIGSKILGGESNVIDLVRQRIGERASPREPAVMICATHAHSTPETSGMHPIAGMGVVDDWLASLVDQLVTVAIEALESLRPCSVQLGTTRLPNLVQDRREHLSTARGHSHVDGTLKVVQFATDDGSSVALVNFACHPVIVQVQPAISADFPGRAAELIENSTLAGGHRAAIFLQGACGDINPTCGSTGNFDDVERYGRIIADSVDLLMTQAEARTEVESAGIVDCATATVTLPSRRRPEPHDLAAAKRVADDPASSSTVERSRAEDLIRLDEMLATSQVAAEVQVLRIGSHAIVGLPGEPFAEIGARIESASPAEHTLIVGYANDYLGYFATQQAWQQGGYEVGPGPWALVSEKAANILVSVATDLLRTLWRT